MASRYSAVELIERLIAFDTTTRNSNLELINFVAGYLDEYNVPYHVTHNDERNKGNLHAVIGPADVPGIVLSGHTDVVPVDGQAWDTDPFQVSRRDERLYGRGTADMKGFIATALSMVPALTETPLKRPIHLALSYDEEVGCLGAPRMIKELETLAVKPAIVIVGEPTDMRVVNAHKGMYAFETTVTGLEQHSSLTHLGVSANLYAAELVYFLAGLAEEMRSRGQPESRFEPPYTSINVGILQGGTAENIIPRECRFTWEYRLLPGSDPTEIQDRLNAYINETVLPKMRAVSDETNVVTVARSQVPPLLPEDGSPAEELAKALAQRNDAEVVSYATEAGQFQGEGIPTVVCGPGNIGQAHRPNEFIALEQVQACETFMERLKTHVCSE